VYIKKLDTLINTCNIKTWVQIEGFLGEIKDAITTIVWPPTSKNFTILPVKHANGVAPLKIEFMKYLRANYWAQEYKMLFSSHSQLGPVDFFKRKGAVSIAAEWETGHITSSHRALNKLALGLMRGNLNAGVLIIPSRKLYTYLTDRVGNYSELAPYFDLWKSIDINNGFLAVIEIEHDGVSMEVPRIKKSA
jgi:hypothetical protein